MDERPLWQLSSQERSSLYGVGRMTQTSDLRLTADKLERARAPYQAASRMRRAADTIDRLENELAALKREVKA